MNKIQRSGFFSIAFVSLLVGFLTSTCIYPFHPEIDETQELLVIDGHIIKGEKVQTINISRSSAYNDPQFLPETGCLVNVVDDRGRNFKFTETGKGTYTSEIPDDLINFNTSYQLFVTTHDKRNYESTPELLLKDSPIDSVYYVEEPGQSAATGTTDGVQIYVDLKANLENARNYRWVMEETWEYQRKYPIEVKWDATKRVLQMLSNSDTLVVCWKTLPVTGFYSSSTANLKVNEKKKIPLNYVSNQSSRLEFKYSLLVKQYSLSESAFKYFNTRQVETQEAGGLYRVQPAQSTSNLINPDVPEEKVLGYFWVSSFSQKRIFVKPPFHFYTKSYCTPIPIDWESVLKRPLSKDFSFYITTILGVQYTAEEQCFDCTKGGGKLKQPEFWK